MQNKFFSQRKNRISNHRFVFVSVIAVLLSVSVSIGSDWIGGGNDLSAGSGAPESGLYVGAYAINISPIEFPVIVNGGMYERTADKVIEPLHARCFVLKSGEKKIAICVVDSCMVPRDILDQSKAMASKTTGIAVEDIMISSTHTHSAPSSFGALGSSADPKYVRFLIPQLAKGIKFANDRLQPAQMGFGVGENKNNVFNRRWLMEPGTAATNRFSGKVDDRAQMNPGVANGNKIRQLGGVDTDVYVVSFQDRAGKPIGVLANYSTHYAGAPSLSADYFGLFANLIQKEWSGGDTKFVAAMSNGTSGDTNCLDFTDAKRKFDRFTVARELADTALATLKEIEYRSDVAIEMKQAELELSIRQADEKELTAAKKLLEPLKGSKPRTLEQVYAREAVLLSQLPSKRKIVLQAIRIGDLAIATFPNEVFTETGKKIKTQSPIKATFNIELANGADGYIPPPAHHKLGGYTTWRARSSCLEEDAEPKIVARLLKLLGSMKD